MKSNQNLYNNVGFEVLTAVVMKSSIFWDTPPCSPLEVNWCFRGTCNLHLQGPRTSQARIHNESRRQAVLCSPLTFILVSSLTSSFTLKRKAICSSRRSVPQIFVSAATTNWPIDWPTQPTNGLSGAKPFLRN
jgi:hypothetical protein